MEHSKKCSVCGEIKIYDNFNKRNGRKIGYSSACKECLKKKRLEKRDKIIKEFGSVYDTLSQKRKDILNKQARERYRINKEKGISKHQRYLSTLNEEQFKKFKEVKKKNSAEYYKKNKVTIQKKARAKRKSGEITLRKYNLSIDKYNKMLEKQQYVCDICGKTDNTNIKQSLPLFIDHNHTTGLVRGLLCHKCNIMIGMAIDDTQVLLKGIEYLNKHEK